MDFIAYLHTQSPFEVLGKGSILGVAFKQKPSGIRSCNLTDVKARVQPFANAIQNCEGAHHKGEGSWEPERLVC